LPNENPAPGCNCRPGKLHGKISTNPGEGALVVEAQPHAANRNLDHGGINRVADKQIGDLGGE
jgi:hypothetical protein